MGILYVLKEIDNTVIWWITYLAIHLLGMLYFQYIHKRIFIKAYHSGKVAIALNLIGPGIGQAYNRQLKKGMIIYAVFLVIMFATKTETFDADWFNWIIIGYYIYTLIDAYLGTTRAEHIRRSEVRSKELTPKVNTLVSYRNQDYNFGIDTNIIMHEPDLLVYLIEKESFDLYMSMMVFNELDGLKKSNNRDVRQRAQLAFDIIEACQKQGKLHLLKTPKTEAIRKYGLGGSPDEKIIGTYLRALHNGQAKLMFVSNDKGARILARNAGMPVVEL